MSAGRVEDSGIASSSKEFMLDLLAIINLQIPLKKTKSMLQKYALLTKKVSVRLFALLRAENAHIRKSCRKIAFGSAQNATF